MHSVGWVQGLSAPNENKLSSAMQSVTKVPIEFDQLSHICKRLLGKRLVSSEAFNDGWFNAAYGLAFDDGSEAVIKIAPPEEVEVMTYEEDIIWAEHQIMTKLQGVVPVPKILADDLGGELIDRPLIIMERLKGITLDKVADTLPVPVVADIRRELGAAVRKIHQIRGDFYGMPQCVRCETWSAGFTNLFVHAVLNGRHKDLDLPYDDCLDLLADTQVYLSEVTEPCLVHWDLWDGNVFVDPETGEFVGLIDFERALYGDPLIEFSAMTLTDEVKAGYGEFDFESESALARRRIYNLYLYLIMSIEGAYRHFEDQSSTKWANEKLAKILG